MTSDQFAHRRPSTRWTLPAIGVALWLAVAACAGGGSKSPTVARVAGGATTTTSAQSASGSTPLARAQAYAQCMRSHGVANFPDPVQTPSGDYGFRTMGIDPKSSAFQSATQTCDKSVPGGWGGTGKSLTAAQQQAWLDWAKCIRTHGVPDFADPTFSGEEVHIVQDVSGSAQLHSAMDACRAQVPSAGGLGG